MSPDDRDRSTDLLRRLALAREGKTAFELAARAARSGTSAAAGFALDAEGHGGLDGRLAKLPPPRFLDRADGSAEPLLLEDVAAAELGWAAEQDPVSVLLCPLPEAGRARGWVGVVEADVDADARRHLATVAAMLQTTLDATRGRAVDTVYRTLVEQLPGVVYYRELDRPLEPFYVSPQVEEVFGYTREEVRSDPDFFDRIVHPDDRDRVRSQSRQFEPETATQAVAPEYRVVTADGSVRWVRNHALAVRDGQSGDARFIVGVIFDVSSERRQEARWQRLLRLSSDLVCVATLDGRFLQVNPAFEDVLGYTADELQEIPARELVHPDDREATILAAREMRRGEPLVHFENRYRTRAGDWRRLSWRARAVPEEGLVYAIARDVTDDRQREARLRSAQRMQAVGRLAGGIAHDFNNLLTVVRGYGELVHARLDGDEPRADVETILEAADRGSSLTAQLLAFSRQQVQKLEILDCSAVIDELSKMLLRLLGEHIRFELELASDLHPVRADRSQLEQVIVNLAVNARDAMPDGGTLRVTTENVTLGETYPERRGDRIPAGEYARISVADSGEGMDPETQERVFEPFFTTKQAGEGTGLGLATVHGIVEQHRGHVWVYSEPGMGATFRIYLPRTDREVVGDEPAPDPELTGGDEAILVVEDDDAVRSGVERMLTDSGYAVRTASRGDEALRLLEEGTEPDLLLTDVVMPGLTGRELSERVRRSFPRLPVVYMSGYPDDMVVRRGVREAEVAYLQKPFDRRTLLRTVRETLDGPEAETGS